MASLYHSALNEQANIINRDIAQTGTTETGAPFATGTGIPNSSANSTSFGTSGGATVVPPTATMSAPPFASSGAANAQMIVNGMMVAAGLGAAIWL